MQGSTKKRTIYASRTLPSPEHGSNGCEETKSGAGPAQSFRLQLSADFAQACSADVAAQPEEQLSKSTATLQQCSVPQTGLCKSFAIDTGEKSPLPLPGPEAMRETFKLHGTETGDIDQNREMFLTQFRFQPFKKCFHAKCLTIFVPGDFNPSSPRRMFCSLQCFESHWRERLSKYLDILNLDQGNKRTALHGAR